MGGAHNVALARLSGSGESNPGTVKGKSPSSKAVKSKPSAYEALIKGRFEPLKKAQGEQIAFKHKPLMGVALVGALSLSYCVIFKNYHSALEKQESLTALFKNPNARVVSGKKG